SPWVWLVAISALLSLIWASPSSLGSLLSVQVNELPLFRSGVWPYDTAPPLVVDPDAVLSHSIALQRPETIPRRRPQVTQRDRGPHLTKLAQRDSMDPRIDRSHALTTPQPLGLLVAERSDHETSV